MIINKIILAIVSMLFVSVSYGRKPIERPTPQNPNSPFLVEMGVLETSVLYPGTSGLPVLPLSVRAHRGDLSVTRIALDIGDNPAKFAAGFKRVTLVDSDGKILSSVEVSMKSLVAVGPRYSIVFGDFSYSIPRGERRSFSVIVDVLPTAAEGSGVSIHPFRVPANGIEVVDVSGSGLSGPYPVGLTSKVIVTRRG